MCSNNHEAMEAVLDAVTEVAAASAGAPSAGAGERIGRLLTAKARLDALVFAEVAALDSAGSFVDDGAATTSAWLRTRHRLGRRDASALVHQARELRDLAATTEALAGGVISREHVVQIVKAKTASGMDAADFAEYEQILVELATTASPDEVRAAGAHVVEAQAPDRDRQLLDALAGRRFDVYGVGDLVRVDAMIDKITAEMLITAIEALSRRAPGDDRTWHQRRADAFSELVQFGIEGGQVPQHGRVRPHVSVTMTLDQLAGIEGTGPLLRRFGRVPAESARRVACDAVLTRILTDSRGEVLDLGRTARHTSVAQNKAITAMYDVCGHPNCDTPTNRCDIHHVTWWSRGGPTDLKNLIPLCKQHHMFVHEGGYTIERAGEFEGAAVAGPKRWRFVSPRGTPIPDHRATLGHHLERLTLLTAAQAPPGSVAERTEMAPA